MKFQLLALIFLWISITLAMEYDQATWGNGEVSSQVNTVGAKEVIQATGDQQHVLYIKSGKENSRLESIYRLKVNSTNASDDEGNASETDKKLKKHGYYLPNTYMIALNRKEAISHSAEIHSIGDISSTSNVKYSPVGASTAFDVSAQRGTIEESVVSFLDKRYGLPTHGLDMVQTFTNGSMGIQSHLVDDAKLEEDISDADKLRESLESVNLYGEIARRELYINKTVLMVEGREIPYVDYGPLPREKMESLLSNTSPERETTPKVLLDSMARLGITDATSISESSSTGPSDGESLIEKYERLSESEKENVKISPSGEGESTCSINSTIASNNVSTGSSNKTDDNWNDSNKTIEFEEKIGANASTFMSGKGADQILETEDTIFVLNTLWPTLEKMYPLNETRNTFKLGGPQQRLGIAFVGRKVRADDYFSEEKLPLNKGTLRQANTTQSTVLTDAGRL
jgi:hypothetical protein